MNININTSKPKTPNTPNSKEKISSQTREKTEAVKLYIESAIFYFFSNLKYSKENILNSKSMNK